MDAMDAALKERDDALKARDFAIVERDTANQLLKAAMEVRDDLIKQRDAAIKDRDAAMKDCDDAMMDHLGALDKVEDLVADIEEAKSDVFTLTRMVCRLERENEDLRMRLNASRRLFTDRRRYSHSEPSGETINVSDSGRSLEDSSVASPPRNAAKRQRRL